MLDPLSGNASMGTLYFVERVVIGSHQLVQGWLQGAP